MPITDTDEKANHVERLYWKLAGEAPQRAQAVAEDFPGILRFEEEDLFVSHSAGDRDRLAQAAHAILGELAGLGGMVCEDCGQRRRFVHRHVEEEIVELDSVGEFVRVIDATTRDDSPIECYECDSTNVIVPES